MGFGNVLMQFNRENDSAYNKRCQNHWLSVWENICTIHFDHTLHLPLVLLQCPLSTCAFVSDGLLSSTSGVLVGSHAQKHGQPTSSHVPKGEWGLPPSSAIHSQ